MISFHTCPLASEEGKETGGMNVYVLELSRELAKNGFFVDVFTRSQDDKQQKEVLVSPRFRVIHLPAGPEKPIPKKQLIAYTSKFAKNYQAFVDREQNSYAILHCHYYLSGLVGLEINEHRSSPLPLIMTFHTLALMKNLVARDSLEKEETKRIDAEFLLMAKAQKIIAQSGSDKQYLEYLYGVPQHKIAVITPGVDTELFKPMKKREAKRFIHANDRHKLIVFVGRIEPLKGIDVLLYAMKILLVRNPQLPICLWIVGGDVSQKPHLWSKELQKLERLRSLLQMTTVVRFVGQRPQHELPYYYNAAEVVVIPSHYESFGMAAIEAMACGIPVITTNVSGVSSLIDEKHEALITSVNNPLLLASQIEDLLKDEAHRQKISSELVEKIQDLSWKNIAISIQQVYDEVA